MKTQPKLFPVFLLLLFVVSCTNTPPRPLTSYVDLFIGTDEDGHTFPGASLPFGMVQLSPDNGDNGYRWCSGYHYSSDKIRGFSHTHYSGTGAENLCDIQLMPLSGVAPSAESIRSDFSHADEQASPGYYAVRLKTFDIKAELTATTHCGMHRYTFPASVNPMLRIDIGWGNGAEARVGHNGDQPLESRFKKLNDSTVVGSRRSIGFTGERIVYFAARTNRPFTDVTLFAEDAMLESKSDGYAVKVNSYLMFPQMKKGDQLMVKVGISSANEEGALAGLSEVEGWNFDAVALNAQTEWEAELQKIEVESPDEDFKKIFYTAAYHNYLAPFRFDDALGQYTGADRQVHKGKNIYTLHSLWDTYRATAPLYTVTQTKRLPDIINSYLTFYRQHGLLPSWELYFNEANVMPGYHSVPIIADAILKGVGGFDYNFALEAMVNTANEEIRESDHYRKYGYVPDDLDPRQRGVTKTVEYAFDDWCIAQVAKKLGNDLVYGQFSKRATYWKNLFDPTIGFARPKDSKGNWMEPFDPESSLGFQEGNSWIYTWYVPQDVHGLIAAMGGTIPFETKLDSLYNGPEKPYRDLKNHGFFGLSEFSNEPSHHVSYLYSYIGKPWKSAEKTHKILTEFYSSAPNGLCGNDDCGQTSAWYIWSALGFYPVNPADGEYVFGSPLVSKAVISMGSGRQFVVKTKGLSKENIYIQSITLNNKPYTKAYITHADMGKGGELCFVMGNEPSSQWGTLPGDLPGKRR